MSKVEELEDVEGVVDDDKDSTKRPRFCQDATPTGDRPSLANTGVPASGITRGSRPPPADLHTYIVVKPISLCYNATQV